MKKAWNGQAEKQGIFAGGRAQRGPTRIYGHFFSVAWQKTASSRFAKNCFPSPFTTPPATSPLPFRFRPLLTPVSVSFHPSRPLPQMEDFLSNLFPWELMMGETM